MECSRYPIHLDLLGFDQTAPPGVSRLGLHGLVRTEVIKLFSCSTQLSMKFQLLIKLKCSKINTLIASKLSEVLFIMLINVKMPTIVGILTFMSMINVMLS